MNLPRVLTLALSSLPLALSPAFAAPVTLTVQAGSPGKAISPDLFGIFFEDLNYAADGGLYAELVQNRSFEYNATEQTDWGPLTGWEFVRRDGGAGQLWVDSSCPLAPANPHCALIKVDAVGKGVGLSNAGFDGIPVKAGEKYDFSLFARLLNVGERGHNGPVGTMPLDVRLETKDGQLLGETTVEASAPSDWRHLTATLTASRTVPDARLLVLATRPGLIALDEISLFPRDTFKGHPNGLRADLAQAIADLHPKFVRFPGGCLVHGDGIDNIYRWKETIGPVEQRKSQSNIWRYHQSKGLGFYEYFQFCEDIGAKPLPVVAAGVSCQNSTRTRGTGQQCVPMDQMPAYIQDVLDLIEYANGPADSKWGSKRAAAGHPAPFHLQYLGIGNEDEMTDGFQERFRMIYDAVKAKHPEITVIGTVGPAPSGDDYDKGWKLADELHVPVVDEHYYERPDWFWANLHRYDNYNRATPHVYVGEYAAHDTGRRNTLRSALAEAAHLTSLERNGDVVRMASYAPLLAKLGHTQWNPDLIYFDNTGVYPTVNYQVQRLFSLNAGDRQLDASLAGEAPAAHLSASAVRDSKTGDLILKIVNGDNAPVPLHVNLPGAPAGKLDAVLTELSGSPDAINAPGRPAAVLPRSTAFAASSSFDLPVPADSLVILRIAKK